MKRTKKQNNSLHLYLELLSIALNNAGYDMKRTLKQDVDIPWNKDTAKEYLWRPIQEIMLGKQSTTKLEANEYIQVYEVLNRHIADKFGISVSWPSIEEMRKGSLKDVS